MSQFRVLLNGSAHFYLDIPHVSFLGPADSSNFLQFMMQSQSLLPFILLNDVPAVRRE